MYLHTTKIQILITVIQSDYVISNARMFSRLLAQVSNRMFRTYFIGVSKLWIWSGVRFNKKRNGGFRKHYENKNNLEFLGMFGSLATTVSSFMFWYHFQNRQILLLDIQKVAVPRKKSILDICFWTGQNNYFDIFRRRKLCLCLRL